jgi:hypothetical protein
MNLFQTSDIVEAKSALVTQGTMTVPGMIMTTNIQGSVSHSDLVAVVVVTNLITGNWHVPTSSMIQRAMHQGARVAVLVGPTCTE